MAFPRTLSTLALVVLFSPPLVSQEPTSQIFTSDLQFKRAGGDAQSEAALRRFVRAAKTNTQIVQGGTLTGVIVADVRIPVEVRAGAKTEEIARAFLRTHGEAVVPGVLETELVVVPAAETCGSVPNTSVSSSEEVTFHRVIGGVPVLGGRLRVRIDPKGEVVGIENTLPAVPARIERATRATARKREDAPAFAAARRPSLERLVREAPVRRAILERAEPVLVPVRTTRFTGLIPARRIVFPSGRDAMVGLLLEDGTVLSPRKVGPISTESLRSSLVHLDPITKLPTFIYYRPVGGVSPSVAGIVANPAEVALRFLEENPAIFRTGKARCQFRIAGVSTDPAAPRVTFVKLQQTIAGLRVFGAELVFEVEDGFRIMSIQGHTIGHADMPLLPKLSPQQAIVQANQLRSSQSSGQPLPIRNALAAQPWTTELVVFPGELFPRKNAPVMASRLAYLVQSPYHAWMIDAITGKPVYGFSRSHGANIVNDGLTLTHLGRPLYASVNVDGVPVAGAPTNTDVATAVAGVAGTVGFYAMHGWVGQNGGSAGSNFVANTNVSFTYPLVGNLCPNANYVAGLDETFYCLGDATSDIVGHEITHGVVQHSSGLVYADESGALNEAYADLMGNLAFPDAIPAGSPAGTLPGWLVGETTTGGAFRNMAAPGVATFPAYLSRTDLGCSLADLPGLGPGCDFGGVHTNSGIINLAHVRLSDGGIPGMTGVTRGRIRMLAFNTMTRRLVSSSRMIDAALATRAACGMFSALGGTTFDTPPLGFTQADCDQVPLAFNSVGLDPDLVSGWVPPTIGFGGTIVQNAGETTDNGCLVTDVTLQMATPSGLLDASALTSPGGVPTINYLGLSTATIGVTTPPIGTTGKTHIIAWTDIFGSTPQISSSLAAPAPAGALNCVTPIGLVPVERVSGVAVSTSIPLIGGAATTTTGNAASSMALPCTLRSTEVEIVDGSGTVVAGPGTTVTHTITDFVFGIPVNRTRTATISAQPPGLVGAANPGAWNLSAPVAWSISPTLWDMRWRLRYYIDETPGTPCNP